MPPLLAFVLGALAGLGVGALAVLALLRATGRSTGAGPGAVLRLIVDGLLPGERPDGVAVQRALARHLTGTASRTASGRRVAATRVALHVGPQDLERIDSALGREAATADLAEFYAAHARRSGWHLPADPVVELVRDISLRPRQAFAQTETRAEPAPEVRPAPAGRRTGPVAVRPRTAPVPVVPRPDEAVTDVLPRQALEEALADEQGTTRAYPVGPAEALAPGDLVVVHGTDVRTVPRVRGRATVGRGRHNDIVVDAPGVQRDHVRLELRDGGWWVVPVGGVAATRLDGRTVAAPVAIGDQGLLELGRGARVRLSADPAA